MSHTAACLAWVLLSGWVGGARLPARAACDPMATFADGRQPRRERFVSPTGSDTAGDGSRARPFRTLGRAASGVQPGDALRLLPGTHAAGTYLANLRGTAEAPIWLGGVPGEARPLIAGGHQALHLVRPRYLVVEHLEVSGATQNGINCDDGGEYANPEAARFVVFRGLFLHDLGSGGNQDALKLSGLNDYAVLDCAFARTSAGGSGIDHVGCHRGRIARCQFTDMGSNAIQCKGGSEDIEIRACRFRNGGSRALNLGGSTGFEFFRPPLATDRPNAEARNLRAIANLFEGSDAPVAWVGAVDALVAHNTIVAPRRWVLRILQETGSSGGYSFLPCASNRFVNNLVWFERAQLGSVVNVGPNTAPGTFEFAHNLWYAFDRPTQSAPGLPAPETGGIVGRDPRFRDVAAADFTLAADSPARGAGRAWPGALSDLAGRCYANPPSLGAFEALPSPAAADTDGDLLPDAWEVAHGLDPRDPTDAWIDADGDGLSARGEFLAGTNPRDGASVFRLTDPRRAAQAVGFDFPTLPGRVYQVEALDLLAPAGWSAVRRAEGTGSPAQFTGGVEIGGARAWRVRVEFLPLAQAMR